MSFKAFRDGIFLLPFEKLCKGLGVKLTSRDPQATRCRFGHFEKTVGQ